MRVWQQAHEVDVDYEAICTQMGKICFVYNSLHYLVMHFACHGLYGETGAETIRRLHTNKAHKENTYFETACDNISDAHKTSKNLLSYLDTAKSLHNNRNYVVHGILMMKVEVIHSKNELISISDIPPLGDIDRFGFGKVSRDTGELETKTFNDLKFWELDELLFETREKLRPELDRLKCPLPNPPPQAGEGISAARVTT